MLLKVAWRFATGRHLDGRRRSDATFFAAGTHADPHYWGRGGESKWALLPGWKRAGIRWAFLVVPLGLWRWRTGTEWVLALICGPWLGLLGLRIVAAWVDFGHYRTKLLPLHYALAPVLEIPMSAKPRTWLEVPHDYGTRPDAQITVYPPDGFTASDRDKEAVTRTVTAKLGIEAPEPDWSKLHGREPKITFRKSVPPPARVTSRDILPAVEAAAEHEVIMGIGKKDQVIDLSLDSEVPHVGFCMTTGDGKSAAAMNMAAQLLHHGGLVVFLDYKLMSHMWARGLPNVAYAGTPAEIHELLCWLACDDTEQSELTRRKNVALASADIRGNVAADLGPRILVVAEELNATQKRLKAFWRHMGGKGPSPAAEALDEVMFMGRQLRIHGLQIAQRLSARASGSDGGADARENLGAILFSNPSASTWKMLCDGKAQPPASDHKGRYQLVTRKTVRELQGALWDEEDARAFATSGVVAVPRPDMPLVTRRAVPALLGQAHSPLMGGPDLLIDVPRAPAVQGPPNAVTLREAVDAGLFRTIEAARKTAQRYEFQAVGERNQAKLYDLGDLHAFIAERARR